ncbi:hypothetical protein BGZ61DRAFT_343873 [Ilyonectria robusta]|uniref:uncharacterized protein n=1 Tax=Ilyonectria robusta TaxID=1079257 RepID=UPI001E8DE50F|nr:uncharacterized protein BGZ61DRAFT_343873 [Ilyonectria robusta]KAH8734098.1 hypothetical protein BGZ61DRAFT_343873 [Ilyonectria robusta]
MYSEQSGSRTNLNRSRDDATPVPSTLPEVVYCELPEVVPDTYPEVVHSTLPQAAHSDLPQVVPGTISPVEYSSLPEATTGQVNGCNMDQQMMTVSAPPPTVSPLHLLGDQPDLIDCPFCERQTKTTVKKKPSNATHIQAVLLLMTTVCGAVAPYVGSWSYDIEQFCGECRNRVTYRPQGKEIRVCKQPESVREVSKYAMASRDSINRET